MRSTACLTAWLVAVTALVLPAVAWGQAAPLENPQVPAMVNLPDAGPSVSQEFCQPHDQPPAGASPGSSLLLPFSNMFNHPPWESSGGPLDPIWRESWLYRPWSVGAFMGAAQASRDCGNWSDTSPGMIGGIRAGWDLNHYWGTETRLAWDGGQFVEHLLGGEFNVRTRAWFWDLDLVYYPWGDNRWRPYALVGMGASQVRYLDMPYDYGNHFSVPIAIGVKYRWNDFWAWRLEGCDDIAFAHGTDGPMHTMSLTLGLEYRFGGTRKAYWPWNPGKSYW